MWSRLREYIIIPFATTLVLGLLALALEAKTVPTQAYLAVESFAPWNLVTNYVEILTISDDLRSETVALRPMEPLPMYVDLGRVEANTHYYTRGANPLLRPLTALIDLLLHLFSDAGLVGFLVSAAQLALGAGLMLILFKKDTKGFFFYTIGLPVGAVLLGSVAAIPLWAVALFGVLALNAAAGFGIQGGSTALALMWVGDKALETAAHETVAKSVTRVVSKVEKILRK